VIDIIVVFRTTILDEESGEEIKDAKIIASSYLKGRFMIDFLSTVPFDSIALVSKFSKILTTIHIDLHGRCFSQIVLALWIT